MLFPVSQLSVAHRNILYHGGTVVFLVAADCDSLCALSIMKAVLKAEGTPWDCRPMRGPNDVRAFFSLLLEQPNPLIRSVVMINCGGAVDIVQECVVFSYDASELTVAQIQFGRPG